MSPNWITALGTVLGALAAFTAVVIAWKVWTAQKVLTEALARRQEELTKAVSEKERLLTQRQLLLPLWQYMSTLNFINPKEPIVSDVLKAVNTLELVAICCEGEIVDPRVVKRTFRETYITLYQQVNQCGDLKGHNKSGQALLNENRAAMAFYQELMKEHIDRDSLKRESSS